MRILIHDYAGHPFQIQLSRSLAGKGYEVIHAYSQSTQTPQGSLKKRKTDPNNFYVKGIRLSSQIDKQSYMRRRNQETKYGKLLAKEIEEVSPDVVISGNTPLDAQKQALKTCCKKNIKFIFWVQDLYSVAVARILRKKIPVVGRSIGTYYMNLERKLLNQSDEIVLITEDFKMQTDEWDIPREKLHVIENWAPLDEMPVRPSKNDWSRKHNISDKKCILYSGTLGMKHNPELLLNLALHFENDPDVRLIVNSEGDGADWLKEQKEKKSLGNLLLLGFQPFEEMPDVLASADVLVAILEKDAGAFSVPSKVLTYHCAGKPLLLSVPEENLAAKIVKENHSGLVVAPKDQEGFVEAADRLINDEQFQKKLGSNARNYAEQTFDIAQITKKFEDVILKDT